MFKYAIDTLTLDPMGSLNVANLVVVTPMMLMAGYGAIRSAASLCSELRIAVFSHVSQRAIRTIADEVFVHLHAQDLKSVTAVSLRASDGGKE